MNHQERDLDELRLRLDRRNQLLEIVRKAYHRDVIVVREYFLHLQKGDNIDEIKPEDLDLRTIPSIDLRNEGFHLFSPQECELSLNPCLHCGGTLEITHRESNRYQALMRCCDDLKTRERDLDESLAIAKHQIEVDKGAMLKQEVELMDEHNRMNADIDRLNKCVADRDELERLCNEQREEIKALEIIRKQKEKLEETLGKSEKEFSLSSRNFKQARATIAEGNSTISKLRKRCEEGLLREKGLNNRLEHMNNTTNDLRRTIETLEELETQLKGELNMCRSEIQRENTTIRVAKEENLNLKQKLATTVDERNATVGDLEQRLRRAEDQITTLKRGLKKEKEASESFRLQTRLELKKMQTIEQRRAQEDKTTNDNLTNKGNLLMNLTSSHIQGLYDQCLEQEHILRLECALPSSISTKKSSSSVSEALKNIEDKLAQKVESIHLNWEALLEDECNRRVVFGNLNNRAMMNLGHIDRLIRRLHGKYENDLKRAEERNKERLNGMCASYDEKRSLLESQEKQKAIELERVSLDCFDTKKRLATALTGIDSLKEEASSCKKIIKDQERSILEAKKTIATTESDLVKTKQDLGSTEVFLTQAEIDVQDRDETLLQLEGLLQNTTDRFARKIEEERIRLETNQDVSIQAEPLVNDVQQQVDFIKNVCGTRADTTRGVYPTSSRFFDFDENGSIQ